MAEEAAIALMPVGQHDAALDDVVCVEKRAISLKPEDCLAGLGSFSLTAPGGAILFEFAELSNLGLLEFVDFLEVLPYLLERTRGTVLDGAPEVISVHWFLVLGHQSRCGRCPIQAADSNWFL